MGKDINNDNSFLIRFRSSIILMIVTVTSIVLGGYVLAGVLLAVSLIGQMELYRALGVNKSGLAVPGYIATVLWYAAIVACNVIVNGDKGYEPDGLVKISGFVFNSMVLAVLAIALLLAILIIYVIRFPKFNSEQSMTVFFGFFYPVVLLSFIYLIRCLEGGQYSVWLLFIGSWGADTMAYLVGRKWGRHKVVPVLSPKKSLEGFIGGIVGAALLGVIYAVIFKQHLIDAGIDTPILAFALIAAVSAVFSIIGDLAASAIKRDKGIKDYGKLIPGHGGILDRFDSVIIIAPVIFLLLAFLAA